MPAPLIVLDFETTGLSPHCGDRTIEVGAVRIEGGVVVDRFQSLMNPGIPVSSFVESYTGITNRMLRDAPPVAEVTARLADFIGDLTLVAHNASFDRRFLDAELARINRRRCQDMLCSVLVSRRVYPTAGSHRLGALVDYLSLAHDGVFHRALADAEMTARLWLRIQADLCRRYGCPEVPLARLTALQKVAIRRADDWLRRALTSV